MSLSVVYRYYPSVESAKARLRHVIAGDREADACGRWVLREWREARYRWYCWAIRNDFGPNVSPDPEPIVDPRPRYRWEVRR